MRIEIWRMKGRVDMRLNFDEISIVTQVMADIVLNPSKTNLITSLVELEDNPATDKLILQSVRSLREKIINISQSQLNKMYEDLANGKISAAQTYELSNVT